MSIKDGGPFHPTTQQIDGNGEVVMYAYCGASLRDHFAGCALIGAMASVRGLGDIPKKDRTQLLDCSAGLLYEMADAMVRAREAGQ